MGTINQSLTTAGLMQPREPQTTRGTTIDGIARRVETPVDPTDLRTAPAANDAVAPPLDVAPSLDKGAQDAFALGYVPLPETLVTQIKRYWASNLKAGS